MEEPAACRKALASKEHVFKRGSLQPTVRPRQRLATIGFMLRSCSFFTGKQTAAQGPRKVAERNTLTSTKTGVRHLSGNKPLLPSLRTPVFR